MLRRALRLAVASSAVAVWLSLLPSAGGPAAAQSNQPRLVVFELIDSTCPTCQEAGAVLDTVAASYERANQPVVFIEYSTTSWLGNRTDRWFDACPDWRQCYLPMELVDSGWRWSCGPKDFSAAYHQLVDQALANPAQAELSAWYRRTNADLDVTVEIVNRSGGSIGPENDATVNIIVYERTRVLNTSRYGRSAVAVALEQSLTDGQRQTIDVRVAAVPVTNWDRAVVVVLVDYRPEEASARHASLQAAIAVEGGRPTATPSPTATGTATPLYTPTIAPTPVWTGKPIFLPFGDC